MWWGELKTSYSLERQPSVLQSFALRWTTNDRYQISIRTEEGRKIFMKNSNNISETRINSNNVR